MSLKVTAKELNGVLADIRSSRVCDPEALRRELTDFRRRLLVEMRGGKCEKCGVVRDSRLMDFHHKVYPDGYQGVASCISKKISVCGEDKFWDEVIPEVRDHCVLLCLACHNQAHDKKGQTRRPI